MIDFIVEMWQYATSETEYGQWEPVLIESKSMLLTDAQFQVQYQQANSQHAK